MFIGGVMDKRLNAEDLEWLKRIRSIGNGKIEAAPVTPKPPEGVGHKLFVLGLAAPAPDGVYRITFKGRDELIDRERDEMRWH
jgi:hypothetical protein